MWSTRVPRWASANSTHRAPIIQTCRVSMATWPILREARTLGRSQTGNTRKTSKCRSPEWSIMPMKSNSRQSALPAKEIWARRVTTVGEVIERRTKETKPMICGSTSQIAAWDPTITDWSSQSALQSRTTPRRTYPQARRTKSTSRHRSPRVRCQNQVGIKTKNSNISMCRPNRCRTIQIAWWGSCVSPHSSLQKS